MNRRINEHLDNDVVTVRNKDRIFEILQDDELDLLSLRLNFYLLKGWKLWGNLIVLPEPKRSCSGFLYIQAITK